MHPSSPHYLPLHTLQAESHELHELDALCVLDFYVHESCQRQGIGKLLFEVCGESVGEGGPLLGRALGSCCLPA